MIKHVLALLLVSALLSVSAHAQHEPIQREQSQNESVQKDEVQVEPLYFMGLPNERLQNQNAQIELQKLQSETFHHALRRVAPHGTPLTSCSQIGIGQGASLNGFVPFPVNDPWNQNIASAAVDASSAAIIAGLGTSPLHPDFGSNLVDGSVNGIPYQVVSGQGNVPVTYNAYGEESDPGPMPVPLNALVEGYPANNGGDSHVLVIDADNCFLYELYASAEQGDGSWTAASGAVWDLLADNYRPYGWTSADAAGLPIFPGLARYDEFAAGAINHALRVTVAHSRAAFVAPASHAASNSSSASYAPMGARLRLKASFDISGYTPQAKVVLTALKTYGMIVADNGGNLYVTGAPDTRWDDDDLHNLGKVPASAFEVVNTGTVMTNGTVPTGPVPVIKSFTSSAGASAVLAGSPVKLSWSVTGASYVVLTPKLGATRSSSMTINPLETRTYTLYANNQYGSTTQTLTVPVQ